MSRDFSWIFEVSGDFQGVLEEFLEDQKGLERLDKMERDRETRRQSRKLQRLARLKKLAIVYSSAGSP